ncbi:MAG: PHP domain-containing protein [Victivallaceae bacterium]|nr:PHP domain-containing protein [Victivallaceae bacterium]
MCKLAKLAAMTKKYNMPAMALTDHGTIDGIKSFIENFQELGVKPIIGCEVYLMPTAYHAGQHNRLCHLTLLAKNYRGYKNLRKLVASATQHRLYCKPVIDKKLLANYSSGLIVLSGCIKGEISSLLLDERITEAKQALRYYLNIFGREKFYLELTDHGLSIQKKVNKGLIAFSKEFDIKVVATNDVHYVDKDDAKAQDLLRCIKNGITILDKSRYSFDSDEFYFKSGEELAIIFSSIPEAISNTLLIAEQCNISLPLVNEDIQQRSGSLNNYNSYQQFGGISLMKTIFKAMGKSPHAWSRYQKLTTKESYCEICDNLLDGNSSELEQITDKQIWIKEALYYANCLNGLNKSIKGSNI